MIGAVWVTCLPADNGVDMGESNKTLTNNPSGLCDDREEFPKGKGCQEWNDRKQAIVKVASCHAPLHWSR